MKPFTFQNTALTLCLDSKGGGTVYSQRLKEPMHFWDLADMILRVEDIMNEQNFPQAFHRIRTYKKTAPRISFAAASPEEGIKPFEIANKQGVCFTILILSRRNATWQGVFLGPDGTPTEAFFSELELISQIEHQREANVQTV